MISLAREVPKVDSAHLNADTKQSMDEWTKSNKTNTGDGASDCKQSDTNQKKRERNICDDAWTRAKQHHGKTTKKQSFNTTQTTHRGSTMKQTSTLMVEVKEAILARYQRHNNQATNKPTREPTATPTLCQDNKAKV